MSDTRLVVRDLGRISYAEATQIQRETHARVLAQRDRPGAPGTPVTPVGELLLLEHDPPVITVSRRPDARAHLIATDDALARAGVEVAATDRGGDITYHGPGQLVAYPIVDLKRLGWTLHAYMRTLESCVIRACAGWGLEARRDEGATGVWIGEGDAGAKVCALGVRVQRWVTMHGLALNVTTNLEHFGLIVPCGLAGRGVTSLQQALGPACPSMDEAKGAIERELAASIDGRAA
ncbi:MAG: lipoyl(octanoyl) transferase LipB [Phycisphaerales bacterium]|nr:MAG: lipoyl(octanoyl) transferase LipB [Phycisphaerales bacterium]